MRNIEKLEIFLKIKHLKITNKYAKNSGRYYK